MRQAELISSAYVENPADCAFPVWTHPDGSRPCYPCPDELWSVHFPAWQKARRGNKLAAEPFPAGHCMFERPKAYGIVPLGCTDPKLLRRAYRRRIVSELDGWDRDLRQTSEGMRQLARIVRATVQAKITGADVGAFHFLATVYSGI